MKSIIDYSSDYNDKSVTDGYNYENNKKLSDLSSNNIDISEKSTYDKSKDNKTVSTSSSSDTEKNIRSPLFDDTSSNTNSSDRSKKKIDDYSSEKDKKSDKNDEKSTTSSSSDDEKNNRSSLFDDTNIIKDYSSDKDKEFNKDNSSDKEEKVTKIPKIDDDNENKQSEINDKSLNKKRQQKKRSPQKEPMFYDEESVLGFYRQLVHCRAELKKIGEYISKKENSIKKRKSIINNFENEIDKINKSDVCDKKYQIEKIQKKLDKQNHQLTIELDELRNLKNKFNEKRKKIISDKRKIKQDCDEKVLESVKNKEEQRKNKLKSTNYKSHAEKENKTQLDNSIHVNFSDKLTTIKFLNDHSCINQHKKIPNIFVTAQTPRKIIHNVSCKTNVATIPNYLRKKSKSARNSLQKGKSNCDVTIPSLNKPILFSYGNPKLQFS